MRYYIIDGMNLIHKSPLLKNKLKDDLTHAQSSLKFEILSLLMNRPRNHFTIVFDGTGNNEKLQNLDILYSDNITADTVIKNMIKESKNHSKLYIISSDTEVYNYARIYAANCLTSEEFIKSFLPLSNTYKTKGNTKQKKVRSEKPQHVSKKEIEEMKKLFGK